ncbi:hypothetical protein JYS44_00145 [Phycisphaeraceae bacterium AH-315-B13]|nr:hypothetical protein [Phycisphaeraceae bacterium AH-315-B13]
MKRTILIATLACPFAAHAQPFAIEKSVIAGGGGSSAGGSFSLSGTIGQHDAGSPMTGGSFSLTGGFWAGTFSSGSRLCADQNEDGLVTPTDFTAWIAAFNQGINGPICNP